MAIEAKSRGARSKTTYGSKTLRMLNKRAAQKAQVKPPLSKLKRVTKAIVAIKDDPASEPTPGLKGVG